MQDKISNKADLWEATFNSGNDAISVMKELIDSADNVLYQSKMNGRNMVSSSQREIKTTDNFTRHRAGGR